MDLRNMIIERILFAADEDTLNTRFQIGEDEVYNMADIDLLELYEALYVPE
jgi:hypothetical protein